jgi:hypothetical protein
MSMPAVEWPEAEKRIAEVARTRRGRHRDRALASYRRTRALELRAGGARYDEIAREVGYANRGTAHKVISQALEAREAATVDFLRQMELARLDALQVSLWDDAMAGDLPSATAVLRIIDARCRLLGLHELVPGRRAKDSKIAWDSCQGPPTVVARPDDCRHVGCYKHGHFERT